MGSHTRWTTVTPTSGLRCLLMLVVLLHVAGCVAIRDEDDDPFVPPPINAPKPVATTPPSPNIPDVVIVNMHEEAASDPSLVKVVGTVVNHSSQDMARLTVRIEARDTQGRAMSRVSTTTLSETIAARGGTSTFEVSLPRSAAIHDYHAELVAR